jgi:hypothetical protein
MSVKQQHRVAILNRQQIETPEAKLSDALQNRVDALQRQVCLLQQSAHDARTLIADLQRDKERLLDERREFEGIARFSAKLAARCRASIARYRSNWMFASRLLRLLPPAHVGRLRELDTMHSEGETHAS